MTPATESDSRVADFQIGRVRSVLQQITSPAISFALWRRSLPQDVSQALAGWVDQGVIDVDRVLTLDRSMQAAVPELSGLPRSAWLREDVEELLRYFRELCGATRVRVVLGIKSTNACRKFHTDHVRVRLITTYVGPGTEWVPNVGVDRTALQHPPGCPRDANRSIVRDTRHVRQTRAGDVLLLKGELFGGARGAVHRSPRIEHLGLKRLVLAMTALE